MKKKTFRVLELKFGTEIYYKVQQKRFPFSWFGIKYSTWSNDLDYLSLDYNFESMQSLKDAIQRIKDRIASHKTNYSKVVEEFEIES